MAYKSWVINQINSFCSFFIHIVTGLFWGHMCFDLWKSCISLRLFILHRCIHYKATYSYLHNMNNGKAILGMWACIVPENTQTAVLSPIRLDFWTAVCNISKLQLPSAQISSLSVLSGCLLNVECSILSRYCKKRPVFCRGWIFASICTVFWNSDYFFWSTEAFNITNLLLSSNITLAVCNGLRQTPCDVHHVTWCPPLLPDFVLTQPRSHCALGVGGEGSCSGSCPPVSCDQYKPAG